MQVHFGSPEDQAQEGGTRLCKLVPLILPPPRLNTECLGVCTLTDLVVVVVALFEELQLYSTFTFYPHTAHHWDNCTEGEKLPLLNNRDIPV